MTWSAGHRWAMKAAAGYGAAMVLLWIFLRHTDWATLADGLRAAEWPLLLGAVVLRLASLGVASLRWQALLEPAGHVPLGGVVAASMMGMTASAVAPMQAAEFVRPYVLSSQQGVDFSTALATAMAEWLLDGFAILALFIPAALWFHAGRTTARWPVAGPVVFLLLAGAGLVMLRMVPGRTAGWAEGVQSDRAWAGGLRVRAGGWFRSFAIGFRTLEHSGGLIRVTGYSLLLSVLTAMSAWLTLMAFELRLPPAAGFLLLGLVTVAGMIPTPGAIGGFHAVCQLGLITFFGVDRVRAVLPVIALHAVLYLPGALVGALCFLAWPVRPQRSAP